MKGFTIVIHLHNPVKKNLKRKNKKLINRFNMQRQLPFPSSSPFSINNVINRCLVLAFILILTNHKSGLSQTIIYDQYDLIENYLSECEDGRITFFPSIACTEKIEGQFNVLPTRVNYIFNDGFARGYNDGPTWQGKGSNLNLGLGISGKSGRFTYVVNPIIHWRENKAFDYGEEIGTNPPFQNRFATGIDFVSRYGDDSALEFYLGQSELKYSLKHILFSISTQNMRWGPAIYNPAIMSINAEGIPHFRIGTNKSIPTYIGNIEANIMWGALRESDYFNNDESDDGRYFSGMTIGYQPSFFEKLSIGFNRIFYAQNRFLPNEPLRNAFIAFSQFFPGTRVRRVGDMEVVGNDAFDQILSFTFTYDDKENDFRAYYEWVRGDFAGGITSLVIQPDHNVGFVAGIIKTTKFFVEDVKLRFIFEHANFAVWETDFVRGSGSLFVHSLNRQGYTNNGQVIGPGIGPGSSAHYMNASLLRGNSVLSFEYQRIRFNDDYFFTNFTTRIPTKPHDLEHQFGIIYKTATDKFDVRVGVFQSLRYSYLFRDGIPGSEIYNTQANLTLKYKF